MFKKVSVQSYRKMDARRTRVADAKRTREGLKTALAPPVLSTSVTFSKSRAPVADEREVHWMKTGTWNIYALLHQTLERIAEVDLYSVLQPTKVCTAL